MKITKLFEGLKRIANGDYVLEGDLISEKDIEVELDDRLVVRGKIVSKKSIVVGKTVIAGEGIEAGWGIKAGCGIEAGEGIEAGCGIKAGEGIEAGCGIEAGEGIKAGWGIEAGEGIKAGWGIEAGEGIEAKRYIHSEKRIFAGISVYSTSENCKKTIKCAELRKGEICYGELVIEKPEERNTEASAAGESGGMSFGRAIEAAKGGKKIARKGWNGKNQYVELASCISYMNKAGEAVNAEHQAIGNKALAFVGTSGVQLGWLASQADMLADDWYIVE